MSLVERKSVCITGASSGIGAGLAEYYASCGWHVILLARREDKLKALTDKLTAMGYVASYRILDVSSQTLVKETVEAIDHESPIDCLICNAGLSAKQLSSRGLDALATEVTMVNTHLLGTIHCVMSILPRMQQRGRGQIALMGSLNSFVTIPSSKIYGSVKAAILHYGLALREQVRASGVDVNVICPGWVESELTDLNTFPMPDKISATEAAKRIYLGLANNKPIITFPLKLALLTRLIGCLPHILQAKLFSAFKNGQG